MKYKLTLTFIGIALFTAGTVSFLRNELQSSPHEPAQRYVKVLYAKPGTLDPAQMNDTASLAVSNMIYSGLLRFTPGLELAGELAESWNTSRNGKIITFHLRKNARFHNGAPIRSSDVVASLERVIAKDSKVYSYYDCIKGAKALHEGRATRLRGVRTIGEDAVEIELEYPFPPFLSVLAGATAGILPAFAKNQGNFFEHPIGSGPFQYVGVSEAGRTEILLRRFDGYFGPRTKIKEMVLRVLDEDSALKEARAGSVDDLANYPLTGDESVFQSGEHFTAPVAATWIIGLNGRLAPFDKVNVRRAFRDALDVEAFRSKFFPSAVPAHGYIPPGLPGFKRSYQHQELAEARENSPSPMTIRIAIPKELAHHEEMKEFLEQSFRAKGWSVEVVPMEWTALMAAYSAKTLQAFLVSMNMDYPDTEFLVRNFESGNPDNFSGLKDKKIDALIHEARATQDRILRQNMYVDLVKLLHDAAVTVDLFHPRGHYWVNRCVQGFEPSILSDVYLDYRNVSLAPDCVKTRVAAQ
jgi:oligopeptide transport system substrate-binding protein